MTSSTVLLPPPLLAISPGDLRPEGIATFVDRVFLAMRAGLCGLLLREPGLGDRALLELAGKLLAGLERRGAGSRWIGIHDRPHLAQALGAQGVHLGFRSLQPVAVRNLQDCWSQQSASAARPAIGFSHHGVRVESAPTRPQDSAPTNPCEGADYLFFGPIYDTPSKRGLLDPVGIDALARECADNALPTWALGGIKPQHCAALRAAGAAGVAVLSGIFGASDPASATRSYLIAMGLGGD